MPFYRRRLPHLDLLNQPLFVTWRLFGSLPAHRHFPDHSLVSGKALVAMDRSLDAASFGPRFLIKPAIADMIVEVLLHNARVLSSCELHAFSVMPNHLHLLASLREPLPEFMRKLKSYTAQQANQMLGLTGQPFWQEEAMAGWFGSLPVWNEFGDTSKRIQCVPVW